MTATSSNQNLEVSVSFGKFENDLLSWEKFSCFSPNKYLEEVEKCATPGSVAQKKAYFESHYKKIAERKAEIILEQEEKQLERNASFKFCIQNRENIDNSENEQSTSEEVNESLEETMDSKECQSLVDAGDDLNTLKLEKLEEIVRVEDKTDLIVQVEDTEKPEEVVCIDEEVKEEMKEDSLSNDTGEMVETKMKETKKTKDQKLIKKTDKNVQTNHARGSPKLNQVTKKPISSKIVTSRKTQPSKETNIIRTTNKAASPLSKASGLTTPRVSKSASTISSMSAPRSSAKKDNVSTLPRKKQTTPNSLHISLNLDQPGTEPTATTTTRRSLIMERMGDKDIVRRAFKTFQKSFNQLKPSGDVQDTTPKQVPTKVTSILSLATPGQKTKPRLAKSDGTEKKGAKKQELSRPGARPVERIHLQAKPKAGATNVKTRRQSLDPKAKSMQGALSKGSSDKVL